MEPGFDSRRPHQLSRPDHAEAHASRPAILHLRWPERALRLLIASIQPHNRPMKSIVTIAVLSLFAAGLTFGAEGKKASSEAKPGKCCVAAKKDGKTCAHPCCGEAAKAGNNCTKCGGSGALAKK